MHAVVVLLIAAMAAQGLATQTPCYPPGACANFAPVPLPLAVAGGAAITSVTSGGPQVVLQSNAVDVETDGGFVISLPTPPPPSPDLPEFAEDHGPNSAVNKVIAHQRNKISLIEAKISNKKQALADHDTWLEQATRAIERVKKQIRETKLSRKAIARNLKHLQANRKSEVKATRRAKLAKELSETRAKLEILREQHDAVSRAKATIARKRTKLSQQILGTGKLLNWHNDQLKAKIQQFEDEEDVLGQVGQTPQNIRHIDRLLEDDEETRMAVAEI
jgi:hypothetical protein